MEQSNEIYKTNGMSETDKELLTTDWEGSDQSSTFCFRILYEERNKIFNQIAYLSDFSRKEDRRNCHY